MQKIYNVGIIGTRFAEVVHIPGFQRHPRFNVAAIAGRDVEHTQEVSRKFGIERWYTDWRRLISEGNFDLISIVTPPQIHCEIAVEAFDKGLHVLCEKPMALNAREGKKMLDRWRKTGLTGMIDHEFRYLPINQRFKKMIQDGYIGNLKRIIVQLHQSWFAFLKANAASKWDWWNDFEKGGGLLGAAGSHYFDAVQHWFRLPKRVWGKLNSFNSERGLPSEKGNRMATADDAFIAVLDLGEGAEAIFDFIVAARPGTGIHITALGSEGTLLIERNQQLFGSNSNDGLKAFETSQAPGISDDPRVIPFLLLLDDLAIGIDQGFSPSPNFEDGISHQQFIDAVKISNERGTWVDFPPSPSR